MRFTIASFAGAVGALVSGTILAIMMQSWIAPQFGEYIRNDNDGLFFPSLLAGYLVIGFVLAYLASKLPVERMRLFQILGIGAAIGLAIFFGDHLITAGWSRLPARAMAVSGLVDSLSIVVAFWIVSAIYRRKVND